LYGVVPLISGDPPPPVWVASPNPTPIDRPDNAFGAQTFSYLINVYVPANYIWIEVELWHAYMAREWMQKASAYQRR
jgi:hypothetical protein